MSKGKEIDLGFSILPLTRSDAVSPPIESRAAVQKGGGESAGIYPENTQTTIDPLSHTGGLFSDVRAAIAFLATLKGARLAKEVRVRRGPHGRWWIEVAAPWYVVAALVAATRGRAYAGRTPLWSAVPADGSSAQVPVARPPQNGTVLLEDSNRTERLRHGEWSKAGLRDLIPGITLIATPPYPIDEAVVVTVGVLGRTILQRASQLGFETEVIAVMREPLIAGQGTGSLSNIDPVASQPGIRPPSTVSALLLHLHWRKGILPPTHLAYLHGLFYLPSTVVARRVNIDGGSISGGKKARGGLLVDLRYRTSLTVSLFASLVPAGEQWLLSGSELSHWRLRPAGVSIAGVDLSPPPRLVD